MVEIRPDLGALLRFLHGQGLDIGDHDEDLGYGVHAWLAAAFGQTIRPGACCTIGADRPESWDTRRGCS